MNEIKILKPLNNPATPFKFVKDETHVAGEGEWEGTPYKYYWGKLYFNGNLIDDETTIFYPVNPNYYMIDDRYFNSPEYDSRIEKYIYRSDDPRDFPMVHQKYVEGEYPIKTIKEIEIKRPSTFNVKAHDIIKKIISIVDDDTNEIDDATKGDILIKIVNILQKHGYNTWLSNTANRATPIEDFLKSLTNEQLVDIIEELTKIKSTLFEIKINVPTDSLGPARDIVETSIINYIIDLAEEWKYNVIPYLVELDIVQEFIKDQMIFSNQEIQVNGKEILLSPNNRNFIKIKDIIEYLEQTPNLKKFLEKIFWSFYFDTIGSDFNKIYSFCLGHVKKHWDPSEGIIEWFLTSITEDALEEWQDENYSLWPSDVVDDNDVELEQYLEKEFKNTDVITEIKIKSPTNFVFVPNLEKPRHGAMNIAGATTSMGKLYWANELVADRAMLQRSEEGIPTHLNFIMNNEEYDQLDSRIKDKLSKSALSTISSYALYVNNLEDVAISEKN